MIERPQDRRALPETNRELEAYIAERVEERLTDLENEIKAMKAEKSKALIWGITTIGTAFVTVVGIIVNFVVGHYK